MKTMVRVPYWRARSASALTFLISFDSGKDGGEFDELGFRHGRDNFRERSFARAGRAPEDERTGVVARDLGAKGFAGTDQVFLAGKLLERARAHAVRQRAGAVGGCRRIRDGFEESHGKLLAPSS